MIIGIDLGTTNSLVSVWRDGESVIIPNALGHHMTPSVVGIDESGDILIGMPARERLVTHPHLTTSLFKRYMGSNKTIKIGKRKFRPEELSSLVLRSLKEDAEVFLGEPVTEAIITVPAYFNDTQRKATRVAGQLAELKVERLLNEPTAAALAYGLHNNDVESQFLVFDLGGGTFDVSLLELFEGVMEVRASAGDNFLGGEDFLDRIIDGFLEAVDNPKGLLNDPMAMQALRDQAERAKRKLSTDKQATISIRWKKQDLEWQIDEEKFSILTAPLLDRLKDPVERALRDARIRAGELNEVILVGGATRMPIVRKLVSLMFGRLPAGHIDPDEVVAMGAAVQAGLKARDAALDEIVMTDVCPYTLGTEVVRQLGGSQYQEGIYMPIIERNTVIPTSRVERVYTVSDNQKKMNINIFQGESNLIKDNIPLGEIKLKIPPKPSGEESIDIRFTYDINGLLEVDATIVSTQENHNLLIEENPGVLSQDEIEKRLKELSKLKIHPRDQIENRTLVARAERLYEQSLGDLREYIGEQLTQFRHLLDRQNPGEIRDAITQFSEILDEIEGDHYL